MYTLFLVGTVALGWYLLRKPGRAVSPASRELRNDVLNIFSMDDRYERKRQCFEGGPSYHRGGKRGNGYTSEQESEDCSNSYRLDDLMDVTAVDQSAKALAERDTDFEFIDYLGLMKRDRDTEASLPVESYEVDAQLNEDARRREIESLNSLWAAKSSARD